MVNIQNLEIINSVNRYLQLVKEKLHVEKAYLFGSYSRGVNAIESDIDIALISSFFSGNRFIDNVEAGVLTWGIDTRIEPITFRPEEFTSENIMAAEIISTGIELIIN